MENCAHCTTIAVGLFCWNCGNKIPTTELERLIRDYFKDGFAYKTILQFLERHHGIKISLRTLHSRLKMYGLSRKYKCGYDHYQRMENVLMNELKGSKKLFGYRLMWHKLRSCHGINVPRKTVMTALQVFDPDGVSARSARRLNRRCYVSQGPNACWHIDGYDKLKPFGFPIHGAIDGYSRKVLWLRFVPSNNDPLVIARLYLNCVQEEGVIPKRVRSDCGTENVTVSAIQCYLRRNHTDEYAGMAAHIYGSSHSNQRQEAWWAFLKRSTTAWIIDFFKELSDDGCLNGDDALEVACARYCFGNLLQKDLDEIKFLWNTHYIRRSSHSLVNGRPEQLYYLWNGDHQGIPVIAHDFNEMNDFLESDNDDDEYDSYFNYLSNVLGLQAGASDWDQAKERYILLLSYARQ